MMYRPKFSAKPGSLIGSLKEFSGHFKSFDYTALCLLVLIPFHFAIPYTLNESFSQAQKYIP